MKQKIIEEETIDIPEGAEIEPEKLVPLEAHLITDVNTIVETLYLNLHINQVDNFAVPANWFNILLDAELIDQYGNFKEKYYAIAAEIFAEKE